VRKLIIGAGGAGLAAAIGAFLGGVAQPHLAIDATLPMQPVAQTEVAWAQPALAPSSAPPPAYVSGTDWLPRDVAVAEPSPAADDADQASDGQAVAWRVEPDGPAPSDASAVEPAYPSLEGDILAGASVARPAATYMVKPES
jgi:hypothetical protein